MPWKAGLIQSRLWGTLERLERLSPSAGRRLAGTFLRLASPFNGPLDARVEQLKPHLCRIRVPNRRALHNHVGSIHAGALVTAGETPAGLLVLKNFPPGRFRIILSNLSATYDRQARTDLIAEARLHQEAVEKARAGLALDRPQLLELVTLISEPGGVRLATVKTTWQVKAWEQVRHKGG